MVGDVGKQQLKTQLKLQLNFELVLLPSAERSRLSYFIYLLIHSFIFSFIYPQYRKFTLLQFFV